MRYQGGVPFSRNSTSCTSPTSLRVRGDHPHLLAPPGGSDRQDRRHAVGLAQVGGGGGGERGRLWVPCGSFFGGLLRGSSGHLKGDVGWRDQVTQAKSEDIRPRSRDA